MNEKISPTQISKYLTPESQAELPQILTFEELDSTNTYLLKNAKHFEQANVACFAESQTAGRGRLGRTWVSPTSANLYMSLLWHFQLTRSEISGLNIVAAYSIIEALRAVTAMTDYKLKWPNDIYYSDKKLAGVLIETAKEENGIMSVIIGIGINVNMPPTITEKDISKPWIDLATITKNNVSRNQLASSLLEALTYHLTMFELNGAESFIKKLSNLDYLKNKNINVKSGTMNYSGTAVGINHAGQLILNDCDNQEMIISAGEASVIF